MPSKPLPEKFPWEQKFFDVLNVHGWELIFAILDLVQPRLKLVDGCIMPADQPTENLGLLDRDPPRQPFFC
jgi:hypothetical protein